MQAQRAWYLADQYPFWPQILRDRLCRYFSYEQAVFAGIGYCRAADARWLRGSG